MRNLFLISSSLLLIYITACNSDLNNPVGLNKCDSLSIIVVVDSVIHSVSDNSLSEIISLFELNKLNHKNYSFYRYRTERDGTFNVRGVQLINGIKVFTSHIFFSFDHEKMLTRIGGDTPLDKVDIEPKPDLECDAVYDIYIEAAKKDEALNHFVNVDKLKTDTVVMEFGYFDLNVLNGLTDKNITSAWKVYPKGEFGYPIAYLNDLNGEMIYFDNGIRD